MRHFTLTRVGPGGPNPGCVPHLPAPGCPPDRPMQPEHPCFPPGALLRDFARVSPKAATQARGRPPGRDG